MPCTYGLKVIIYGNQRSITNNEFCIPVCSKFVLNANEIAKCIDSHPTSMHFIIVFLDLLHPSIDVILTQLSQRNNVTTFICDNSINNVVNFHPNVFRISQHLITSETTFRAIRAYKAIAKSLYEAGSEFLAIDFEEKANELKQWLIKNNRIRACHILIIPLNTTDDNLVDFQQHLMDFCKRLYPTKEIIICTIYDYIALEESNLNDNNDDNVLNDSSFLFRHEQRKRICQLLSELAPIRIYLPGNERHIGNYWSRLLIAKELDNGHDNVFQYVERCTFMENQPINSEIRRDVRGYLGCAWQVTKTIPMRLEEIEKDTNFHNAIIYVYDTLDARERETNININLCQQGIHYQEYSSDYSNKFHMTGQAQHGPNDRDQNFSEQMDTIMQRNYRQSSSN